MQQNIEHPENDACYEGLAVNKGIEQPDPVNPAIAERLKHLKKKRKCIWEIQRIYMVQTVKERPVLPMLLHMRFAVYRFGVKKVRNV